MPARNFKYECECGNPVDHSLPTRDIQCARCFELNRYALAMHERTRRWLNPEAWEQSQLRQHQKRRWRYAASGT